jgi:ligand-binding sensor domain-containing protein
VVCRTAKGIVVYDSGENILSASDDRWALVPVKSDFENQNILPRSIYSDSDGRIWIGTVSGVFVIDCGSEIFESNNSCETRYPYIQDGSGIGAFLNGQTVNVITEDGAGRKWFGTNTGIYVTNASVDEVILNLTPNNSPLADANVNVIEIDKKSGDVYIGTSAGVQIYKTDASIGNAFHDAKLVIYPNPVKPSYEGPIVIQGLAHESSVKIADVTGKLVFETQSLGSQAIWYGRDLNGNKVGTGVYTVFGTTTLNIDNPTGIIGKIIYIK